jgi:hypothetical protein
MPPAPDDQFTMFPYLLSSDIGSRFDRDRVCNNNGITTSGRLGGGVSR